MDLSSWVVFGLLVTVALALGVLVYRRWEAPGRGRMVLAALRTASIGLLLLLLFDPEVRAPAGVFGGRAPLVLLDGSLSMLLPAGSGWDTRWDRARAEASRVGGDVVVFGDRARRVGAGVLDSLSPTAPSSRLLPALRAAAESGGRRVVIVTDGAIEDAAEVARALPALGVDVEVRTVGEGEVPNRAVTEIDAPAWVEAGDTLRLRVGVAARGGVEGPVRVVAREGDRVVAEATVETPPAGRIATATLAFEAQAVEGGLARYEVAIEPQDAVPADDRRSVYVHVGERPAGVAVVSFRPDHEPRFLQPVLEQALGLPVRGYLHTTEGRYVRIGAGADAGVAVEEAEVRRSVEEAELVVVHGLGPGAPAWAREAVASARRALVFPAPDASGKVGGLSLTAAVDGEWFPHGRIPASPIASLLAGIAAEDLPPLGNVRRIDAESGAWAPLEARLGRTGMPAPVAVAAERDGRRYVVATADGYWRWAFRGGEARQAYRRLWSALAGWLAEDDEASHVVLEPESRSVAQGEALAWRVSGMADSVELTLLDEAGAVVADTVMVGGAERFRTPPLAPGHYRYRAKVHGAEGRTEVEGPITVESYSPEFLRAAHTIESFDAGADGEFHRASLPGTPLHTLPWPYLLLVVLISAEWVLRKRWGLR